jgi:hypothetical protein
MPCLIAPSWASSTASSLLPRGFLLAKLCARSTAACAFTAPQARERFWPLRLCEAGFIGFGRVFELVARYPDAADDLVAVLYADPNGTPFTEQLANAVLTLIDHRRPADPWLVEEAIEALQTIPIEKRTPSALDRRLRLAAIHVKDDAAVGRRHVGIDVVGEHDLGVSKLRADELHEERRRPFIAPAQFDQAAFEKVVVLGGETARERPERL